MRATHAHYHPEGLLERPRTDKSAKASHVAYLNIGLTHVRDAMLGASVFASAIDNVRVGIAGLTWSEDVSGSPYLWEVLLLGYFFFAILTCMAASRVHTCSPARMLVASIALVFMAVLCNMIMFADDPWRMFVGNGQARVLMYQVLLAICLSLSQLQNQQLNWLCMAVIGAALANACLSCSWAIGMIDTPTFWKASRLGYTRASGLLQMPGYTGTLLAMGMGLCFCVSMGWVVRLVVVSILAWALVLSDSKTGFAAVLATIAASVFVSDSRRRSFALTLLVACVCAALAIAGYFASETFVSDDARLESYGKCMSVFLDRPFGTPFGQWERISDEAPPHNFILFFLVYGGLVSAIGLLGICAVFLFWISPSATAHRENAQTYKRGLAVIAGASVASMFEQVVLQASTMIPLIGLCFCQTVMATRASQERKST